MRAIFARWFLILFVLSGVLPGEFLAESQVKPVAEEDSSERQDESFKAASSRKRNARPQKTKRPQTSLLAAPVWPSYTPFVDDRRLFSPATPWNPSLHQLHQVFRI
jgi:hypothetical protein